MPRLTVPRRFACAFLALALSSCEKSRSQVAPSAAPVVPVSQPVEREVTEYVDFTGRTEAVRAVDIRARVTGYLMQMPFKEGAEVKKGDLLFEIDARPYHAQHDQSQSQITLNEASYRLARTTYERDRAIASSVPGGVSQQQLDQDLASMDESRARVKASQESAKIYKLNVDFCRVTSPIDGKISRYYLTEGNLINQDQTLLTTVVSLDPMYVYFDMDEPTLLRIRRMINEGRIKRPAAGEISVLMGLQGEDGFPHKGVINFVNNQVNPTTGSISVRGVFANPEPANGEGVRLLSLPLGVFYAKPPQGVRLLTPGMFVHIRLPIGQPYVATLIVDRAIGSDQGLKFVYVLDADNKVQYRRVTTGPLEEDGLRVITDGLKPDDWVVVGGLQQVRPQMVVQPDRQPMPSIALRSGTSASSKKPPPAGTPKREGAPAAAPKTKRREGKTATNE